MGNRIVVQVNEEGEVSYDLEIDNSMTMLIALVDAMNHNQDLANIIEAASGTRKEIRDSQQKALDDEFDQDQIDMFNEEVKKLD